MTNFVNDDQPHESRDPPITFALSMAFALQRNTNISYETAQLRQSIINHKVH